jgi:hypothetical protein
LVLSESASAADPYDDVSTPQGWAYLEIMAGEWADFNRRCGTNLPLDDARWGDNCRTLPSRFVRDLLTRAPWQAAVPFEGVRIQGAYIVGDIDLAGAKLSRPFEFTNGRIEGAITLDYARTDNLISLAGSRIGGDFKAFRLRSESDLLLGDGAVFSGTVVLKGANIVGDLQMSGSRLEGKVDAESLKTGGSVFIRDADFTQTLDMTLAHVGGGVDLRGATLAGLNLAGASIDGELRVGGAHKSVDWRSRDGALNLRYTHVGRLMDAKDAWPAMGRVNLDGFTFDHLGGIEGDTASEMAKRGADWWEKWLRLDPRYSPTTYAQLATAFKSLGDSDAADEILYLGRVRESENLSGVAFLSSQVLREFTGFGIGYFVFRILDWALVISLLGAIVLRFTEGVRRERHQFMWCFGASVNRLLPIIELNRDFTEFFDDAQRNGFRPWQSFFFSIFGIVGLLLAAILAFSSGAGSGEITDFLKLLIR